MNNESNSNKSQFISLLTYFYGCALLCLLYLDTFLKGNYDVNDRLNYFNFFVDPSYSRFEPGFKLLGKFFKLISISPELSLTILAFGIFVLSALTINTFFTNRPFFSLFVLTIIFFAVTGIFSFAQLRAGLALWLSLWLYVNYINNKSKLALFAIIITPFIHLSAILFAVVVISHHILKIRLATIIIASILGSILFIYFTSLFFAALGIDPYYAGYLNEYRNNISDSPLVISYFTISCVLYFFRNSSIINEYKIQWAGLPLTILAYMSDIDFFVKFSCPFIFISWILVLKLIIESRWYSQILYKPFVFTLMFILSVCSIYYASYRYFPGS